MHRQSQSAKMTGQNAKKSHQAVTMGTQHRPGTDALNQGVSGVVAAASDPQALAGAFGTS